MGKLGQMGGLRRRVREKWLTGGWQKEIRSGCVQARDEENSLVRSALPGHHNAPRVSRSDRLKPDASARVKVALNLPLSYGFNQTFDEGLGTVHNLWPWLSRLKSIFWLRGHQRHQFLHHICIQSDCWIQSTTSRCSQIWLILSLNTVVCFSI